MDIIGGGATIRRLAARGAGRAVFDQQQDRGHRLASAIDGRFDRIDLTDEAAAGAGIGEAERAHAEPPQEAQGSLGAQVSFPARLGQPDEYTRLVEAFVGNPMLNGETIRIDVAARMAPR